MSEINKLMHFLDTNIFFDQHHPSEVHKRSLSIELLDRDDGALSVRCFRSFTPRTHTRTKALPHDIAVALMRTG
jgi:hypothetical protein